MRRFHSAACSAVFLAILCVVPTAYGQEESESEYYCLVCHGEEELWEDEQVRFFVTQEKLAQDIHWQKGLRCHDCHGGDPTQEDYAPAHDAAKGFRKLASPGDIPAFCGKCHSDVDYMRRYNPSPRTDQESEYWSSGHGKRLKQDPGAPVATCTSCHGWHGIRAVKDLECEVYPTNVAKTCAECHSKPEVMKGFTYHGRSLGHGQYDLWEKSVHGKAMMEGGDLSAPTCNDCHGNHGAQPPDVSSVANACGTCHGRVAELFEGTRMAHGLEKAGLPGCATCHSYHDIYQPTDDMLGMEGQAAVCNECHRDGKFGATLAGADQARAMRDALEWLKADIREAHELVSQASRLGMEVRGPEFELLKARSSVTAARTLVHTFALEPLEKTISEGREAAASVKDQAQAALEEHTSRRIWLASSLLVIGAVLALLLLYVRRFPADTP